MYANRTQLVSNATWCVVEGTGGGGEIVNHCRKRDLSAIASPGHVRVEGSVITVTETAASNQSRNEAPVTAGMMD